jgi:hypothetical protein
MYIISKTGYPGYMMMKGNTDMLTLSDINALTNSKDGDIYSDLYKDVYGSRPRYAQFRDLEEFQDDYDFLCNKLDEQIVQEAADQAANFLKFTARVAATMYLVENATRERAIEIIADAGRAALINRELVHHRKYAEWSGDRSLKPWTLC